MPTQVVPTRAADIAVWESSGVGPAVLLIHGNSSCKEIFRHQFDCTLGSSFRLIALDLPGHGASTDARDPEHDYTMGGYAETAVEVLKALGVARACVFGWSLGGHIAMDMISRFEGVCGVMTCGSPPVPGRIEGLQMGFNDSPHMSLSAGPEWSEADAYAYSHATAGENAPFEPFMLASARRTDGRARHYFFADVFAGGPQSQREIAQTSKTPLAIVNGAEDTFLKHDYYDTVAYANLWDGRVHSLAGLGHAPFWEAPDLFNPLLERFVIETAG